MCAVCEGKNVFFIIIHSGVWWQKDQLYHNIQKWNYTSHLWWWHYSIITVTFVTGATNFIIFCELRDFYFFSTIL